MATKKSQTIPTKDLAQMQSSLYVLRMKKLAGELKETHQLRALRKDIARGLTSDTSNL